MNKNTKLVVDFVKMQKVKDAIHDMQRNENVSPREVINAFEDALNSMQEVATESDEDIANRILDSFKDDKSASNEVIRKAVEDAMAKRDYAKKVVDLRSDNAKVEKFAEFVIDNIEKSQKFTLAQASRYAFGNDVAGLIFPQPVEVAIQRAWERSEYIFREIFAHSNLTYIPFTTQDWRDNDVRAHIHENPNVEKVEQHLEVDYLHFETEYLYKLQYLRRKQIELAKSNGTLIQIVAEIIEEGMQQLINTHVYASLVTGATAGGTEFIKPIARTVSDDWVAVATMSGANPTIKEVRFQADKVIGDWKVAIMSSATKSALEELPANTTGMTYMSTDQMLAQIGCQEVRTFEGVANMVIILARGAYNVGPFAIDTVQFEKYEYNKEGYRIEKLSTGDMRFMKGAAVLLPQIIEITISANTLTVTTGSIADGDYTFVTGNVSEVVSIATGSGSVVDIADGDYRVVSDGSYLSLIPKTA